MGVLQHLCELAHGGERIQQGAGAEDWWWYRWWKCEQQKQQVDLMEIHSTLNSGTHFKHTSIMESILIKYH